MPDGLRRHAKGMQECVSIYGPARVPRRGLVAWLRAGVAAAVAAPMRMMLALGTEQRAGNGK